MQLQGDVLESFKRVLSKTTQGLYFGLYQQVISTDQLQVLHIFDYRDVTREDLVDGVRSPGFRDITDEPISSVTPSGWMIREPVFIAQLKPVGGGPATQRLFRLVRDTPVEWITFQPDIFSFGFVQHSDGRAVCILDLWETLLVAVAAPWPNDRGPLRRGKKNPLSRDKKD